MAKVSAAVISGLVGLSASSPESLPLLLLPAAELFSSLGLELSGRDGGRSMTRSGVCFRLIGLAAVAEAVATGADVRDDRFSHRSLLRTNDPLLTPEAAGVAPTPSIAFVSHHSPTVMLTACTGW